MGWPGPMTHRQFLAWHAYLAAELNQPDRSDHYAMQTALEIRRAVEAFGGRPRRWALKDFALEFREQKEPPVTPEQRAAMSKARWLWAVGLRGGPAG